MKILHVIYIPFRDVGINDSFKDAEWLCDRIEIFKDFTLKSLLNQSDRDFILWMSFRPEDYGDIQVELLDRYLTKCGMKHVFTYHGLMYWDDKFGGNLFETAKNFARIFRRCYRNHTWGRLFPLIREWRKNESKNTTLPDRLTRALWSFKHEFPVMNYDFVYLTRLDSDDMLNTGAIERIKWYMSTGLYNAVTMGNGYIFNKNTGQLAYWHPLTNPPFHTILFLGDQFFDSVKHLAVYGKFKSHEDIPKLFNCAKLLSGEYCVLIHSKQNQISTIWDHHFRGEEIELGKEDILRQFGIAK